MRVLVACEFSGTVRRAFRALGHDAWSCDILPPEDGSPHHFQEDVRGILGDGWDLMIAHPPCTHLAVSGARWFNTKRKEQDEAIEFVRTLLTAPIDRIALENPASIISSRIRPADQTIQPWQFGHGELKTTCLWLKNLPLLQPTNIVEGREQRVWRMPPGPDRWKERSRTFTGIAAAMADQWGNTVMGIQEELWPGMTCDGQCESQCDDCHSWAKCVYCLHGLGRHGKGGCCKCWCQMTHDQLLQADDYLS